MLETLSSDTRARMSLEWMSTGLNSVTALHFCSGTNRVCTVSIYVVYVIEFVNSFKHVCMRTYPSHCSPL